jgi:hypothetical protein
LVYITPCVVIISYLFLPCVFKGFGQREKECKTNNLMGKKPKVCLQVPLASPIPGVELKSPFLITGIYHL